MKTWLYLMWCIERVFFLKNKFNARLYVMWLKDIFLFAFYCDLVLERLHPQCVLNNWHKRFPVNFTKFFFFYKTPPNDCFCISHAFQKHRYNKICPPRQQKFTKKDSKRYLMFGPNNILLTLRWNDGCFPGHENVCRLFLNRCKWLLGPSKLRNRVFVGKCCIWILIFKIGQNHCV